MCLILFALETHPRYRLAFAANRDEFYDRPTRPAGFWRSIPGVLAGKDLKGGGTWMGIAGDGRFAAITNYRDPSDVRPDAPTRGMLVLDYLAGTPCPERYLRKVSEAGGAYNGFNLLAGDGTRTFHYSNRRGEVREVPPGRHALSNAFLDTPWPKAVRGKALLSEALGEPKRRGRLVEDLFAVLRDDRRPPDEDLPSTGVPLEWERTLSPMFVSSEVYGTRSSTVLLLDRDGNAFFSERTYELRDGIVGETETRRFSFRLETKGP